MMGLRRRAGWMPMAVALLWSGAHGTLLACPICFQIEQGPVTNGVRAAVLVLMGVTVGVLTGFGLFVRRLVRASNPPNPPNPTNPTNPMNPTNPTNLTNPS
jgi:hypothetical protein